MLSWPVAVMSKLTEAPAPTGVPMEPAKAKVGTVSARTATAILNKGERVFMLILLLNDDESHTRVRCACGVCYWDLDLDADASLSLRRGRRSSAFLQHFRVGAFSAVKDGI